MGQIGGTRVIGADIREPQPKPRETRQIVNGSAMQTL